MTWPVGTRVRYMHNPNSSGSHSRWDVPTWTRLESFVSIPVGTYGTVVHVHSEGGSIVEWDHLRGIHTCVAHKYMDRIDVPTSLAPEEVEAWLSRP